MAIHKSYKQYQISIFSDPYYDAGSADNPHQYTYVFFDNNRENYIHDTKEIDFCFYV